MYIFPSISWDMPVIHRNRLSHRHADNSCFVSLIVRIFAGLFDAFIRKTIRFRIACSDDRACVLVCSIEK
jgi:hypothetical protein